MIYTTGVWAVRQGSQDEFVRIWQEMAETMAAEYPGLVPRLLRDLEDPRRFFTVAGPWRDPEQVSEALASPQFEDARAALQGHLESIAISTSELVAEAGGTR